MAGMSGHSKWAGIKHKKAIVDARRGAQFTKLARAISVAAREGGGDPDANAALTNAIQTVLYEGYGPGGTALLIEAYTENRNRTGADVRHILSKSGASLGEPGS